MALPCMRKGILVDGQERRLGDSNISVSSTYNPDHGAPQARINNMGVPGSWCPSKYGFLIIIKKKNKKNVRVITIIHDVCWCVFFSLANIWKIRSKFISLKYISGQLLYSHLISRSGNDAYIGFTSAVMTRTFLCFTKYITV